MQIIVHGKSLLRVKFDYLPTYLPTDPLMTRVDGLNVEDDVVF